MEGLTIIISVLGLLLCFVLKPHKALIVYALVLFAYPPMMTVALGEVDWNAPRIVVIGLFINCLMRDKGWRNFHWAWIDTLVLAAYLGQVWAVLYNAPLNIVLIRQLGGGFFDLFLPYLCARMALRQREHVYQFIAGLAYMSIPLAFFALYESITGRSIYSVFYPYYGFGLDYVDAIKEVRHGLFRASGSFGIPILLGLFFAAVAATELGLWNTPHGGKIKTPIVFCILLLGVFASMSSAPLFSIVISMALICVFPWRRFWPVFAVAVIASITFMELYSNRHFYYVLTYLSFDMKTAYYRIELLDETFGGGMTGHWAVGYGYVGIGPGNDNTNWFWQHKDLTNIYIAILVRYGLLGLLPYLAMNIVYYYRLFVAARATKERGDLWLIWCIAAALVGWNIAMMTVSAFRQIETYQYMLIALCQNFQGIVSQHALAGARVPAPELPPAYAAAYGRSRYGRRFGGHRQLERPGLPPQMPEFPPQNYGEV